MTLASRLTPGRALAGAFVLFLIVSVVVVLVGGAPHSLESFDPSTEFALKDWVPIHLGGLDLSINKAVVYLLVGSALTCVIGILVMRLRLRAVPGRRQTFGETLYDIAQTQVAETGLPHKAIALWFPYCATLMLFIFVVNLLGFLPLPFTGQTFHHIPVWGIYAATSQISVTLALALMTFLFTHVEGIRFNGVVKYFRSWIPRDLPKAILPLIVPIEVLSQFMRLISLSVRLYANMLAGHILILTMIGLMFIIHSWPYRALGLPAAFIFYIFEVVIVVSIQAFIFAALSAIYIGSAIEPEH
ncbi:MAG: F0F1 ATP synthase subunit A [Actinobacteria bacterium]|nr:F0F1 ATP synthase subunit A [Actinomycetota bacterium]MBV8395447.1 F0F1 ATP synthase subunit A [Actinomycetota bacterium]MBV8597740.1 F0F1 ATP synthase subunit A [Actinomycetota bacterium]